MTLSKTFHRSNLFFLILLIFLLNFELISPYVRPLTDSTRSISLVSRIFERNVEQPAKSNVFLLSNAKVSSTDSTAKHSSLLANRWTLSTNIYIYIYTPSLFYKINSRINVQQNNNKRFFLLFLSKHRTPMFHSVETVEIFVGKKKFISTMKFRNFQFLFSIWWLYVQFFFHG